jgi:hypothetical protein
LGRTHQRALVASPSLRLRSSLFLN